MQNWPFRRPPSGFGGGSTEPFGLIIPRFRGQPEKREDARGAVHVTQEAKEFTPEFKAEAVRLTRVGDRTIAQVAVDLDLTETALREWVKRADADEGKGSPETLTTAEREELTRLRRENKRLQTERDILKAAATFFAKESE